MNVNTQGQTHDQLQAACWKEACRLWHPYLYGRLICIPNDMHAGNVVRWKQYQALGVTPGAWDMVLYWFAEIKDLRTSNGMHFKDICMPAVHWFEFKVGNDDLSKAQIKFCNLMKPLGHHFHIISEEQQFYDQLKIIIEPTIHIAKQIWPEAKKVAGRK